MAPYRGQPFLLAVSGGLDSRALFAHFLEQKQHHHWEFSVAHIHHGPGAPEVLDYRNAAQAFCRELCHQSAVPFYSNVPDLSGAPLSSEAQFRELRYRELGKLSEQMSAEQGREKPWLVLAHHKNDLLETRLVNMIRGVGPQGLEAMTVEGEGRRLRPLLGFQRSELKAYLEDSGAQWLEDPSNSSDGPLRNWLRTTWLPQLEDHRPGSLRALSRSLENLTEKGREDLPPMILEESLLLEVFYTLSLGDQRRALAQFMNHLGLKNYGLSHINEALKRLDSPQKDLSFSLLKRHWKIDAGRLKVLRPGEIEPDPG